MTSQDKEDQNIKVHVRIRPLNKSEIAAGSDVAIEAYENEIYIPSHNKAYVFDGVYSEHCSQNLVFRHTVQSLIQDIIKGFNVTLFAYGQTGTGKTYTMSGNGSSVSSSNQDNEDNHKGLIPRAIVELFEELEGRQGWILKVCYLELYNEVLMNLLHEDRQEIKIMEKGGINVMHPCTDVHVTNLTELLKLFELGTSRRVVGKTLMNEDSSRSHAVFTLTLQMQEDNADVESIMINGKVNFVDLAGSENVSRSGADKQRACEAGKINQSLLAIGRVINALVDRNTHVPYRESKLTRILQDSLGGNTKTTIIATISPSIVNIEETIKTLDYAYRAKKIKNHPEQSRKSSKKVAMSSLTNEIEKLRKDLEAQRTKSGVCLNRDAYYKLLSECNIAKFELNEREDYANSLQQKIIELNRENEEKLKDLYKCKRVLKEQQYNLATTETNMLKYKLKCEEKEIILKQYSQNFIKLTNEAEEVLNATKNVTNTEMVLRNKINRLRRLSEENFKCMQDGYNMLYETNTNFKLTLADYRNQLDGQIETMKTITRNSNRMTAYSALSALECFKAISNEIHYTNNSLNDISNRCNDSIKYMSSKAQKNCITIMDSIKSQIGEFHLNKIIEKLDLFQNYAFSLRNSLDSFVDITKAIVDNTNKYTEQFVNDTEEEGKRVIKTISTLTEKFGKTLKMRKNSYKFQMMDSINVYTALDKSCGTFKKNILEVKENFYFSSRSKLNNLSMLLQLDEDLNENSLEIQNYLENAVESKHYQIHNYLDMLTNKTFNSLTCITDDVMAKINTNAEILTNINPYPNNDHINEKLFKDVIQYFVNTDDLYMQANKSTINIIKEFDEKISQLIKYSLSECLKCNVLFKDLWYNLSNSLNLLPEMTQNTNYQLKCLSNDLKSNLIVKLQEEYQNIKPLGDTPKKIVYHFPKVFTSLNTELNSSTEKAYYDEN